MEAVIMVGISGSGKSTKARKTYAGYKVIERDMIRRALLAEEGLITDSQNLWSVWKFNKDAENEVTRQYNIDLGVAAAAKNNIVCADTNLSAKTRDKLKTTLESLGYTVKIDVCEVDLATAWERDERRRDTVGRKVIAEQYQKFLEFKGRKKYVPDTSKPRCILVDVDGTLAHMNGKRSPYEWDKVGLDDVDQSVRLLVNYFYNNAANGDSVIILSGRDGVCRSETINWFKDKNVRYHQLFMRAPNDMRKDTVVKEEIFWKEIADKYNVQFVVDDRPSVCRMWRELGLKVFQVGDPHIEF